MKFIIYNPATFLFDFFLESLSISLKNKNHELLIFNNNTFLYDENINHKKDIIIVIVNPHFIIDYPEIEQCIMSIKNKFKYKILYITEPINFMIEKKIYVDIVNMLKPFVLWTYTNENLNKLNVNNRIFRIFPLYNLAYNFINIDLNNIKNRNTENIVFIGNITDNRKDICNIFGKYLINKTESWTKEQWKDILNNNLFYLNIHRRVGCKSLELFRIVPLLANGGVIFSESVNKDEEKEFEDYNIIFTTRENLINLFNEYKKNIDLYYEQIYFKTLLYRKNMLNNDRLDSFFKYFNQII
jgi:hypothetical protein